MRFLVLLALVAVASAATVSNNQKIERDMECDICKYVISVLSEDNVNQIIEKVEEVCGKLQDISAFVGYKCTKLVNNVLKPNVEDILANKDEPEKVCKKYNMC